MDYRVIGLSGYGLSGYGLSGYRIILTQHLKRVSKDCHTTTDYWEYRYLDYDLTRLQFKCSKVKAKKLTINFNPNAGNRCEPKAGFAL